MPTDLPERCCGRCQHGRLTSDIYFRHCVAPFTMPKDMPGSIKLARHRMSATDGESCPAFVNKEGSEE